MCGGSVFYTFHSCPHAPQYSAMLEMRVKETYEEPSHQMVIVHMGLFGGRLERSPGSDKCQSTLDDKEVDWLLAICGPYQKIMRRTT